MNENIERLLNEEIAEEVKELNNLELGSDTYKVTVNGLAQLYDKSIELKKLEMEMQQKEKQMEIDAELKLKEMEGEQKDRKTKNWITAIGIGAPLVVGSFWSYKSLKFEETGTMTSTVSRNMINGLTKLKFWK